MGDTTESFIAEVHASFGFLVGEAGFTGPEHRPCGPERGRVVISYRTAGLRVEVTVPGHREPAVDTRLVAIGPDGQPRPGVPGVPLPTVYVAAGFGPRSEVPADLPEDESMAVTAVEFVRTHAAIVRRALPLLLTAGGELSAQGEELINARSSDGPSTST